jgi:uncharacterized membrane protein YphA (DoxX/SURF4 family)
LNYLSVRIGGPLVNDVAEWCRFVLATVFLLAGVAKVTDLAGFGTAVDGYGLLPPALSRVVGSALPPVEIAAALLLAAGVLTRVVAAVLGVLLVAFAGAVAVNLLRGRRMSCACFGTSVERDLTWWTVGRNVLLIGAVAVVVTADGRGAALPMLVAGTATVLTGLLFSTAVPVLRRVRRLEVAG